MPAISLENQIALVTLEDEAGGVTSIAESALHSIDANTTIQTEGPTVDIPKARFELVKLRIHDLAAIEVIFD